MPLVIFLGFLVLYWFGVSPAVSGGDAGDIILSYFSGGIAHPPGYPLNTLLGYLLTRLIPASTFAFKANFVSAIYLALSVSLLFLLLKQLTKSFWVSLSGAAFLGIVPLFWLYAHIAEVFQLTILLNLLSLHFLFKWFLSRNKLKSEKFLFLSIAIYSLSIFHHQIPIFLLPAYAYLIWKSKVKILNSWKKIAVLISIALLGSLPYLYSVYVSLIGVPTNWGAIHSVGDFVRLIFRGDYGTFSASKDLIGVPPGVRLSQIIWYLGVLKADFSLFGILLILVGACYLFIKERIYFWFFSLAWLFTGPFFVAYAAFSVQEAFLRGVSERFFLQSYPFLAVFAAFGLLVLYQFVTKISILNMRKELLAFSFGMALFFFPLTYGFINWPKTDLSQSHLGDILASDLLIGADKPGIIFLQGDTQTFAVQYMHFVNKVNPQSKLIMLGRFNYASYREELRRMYPDLIYPDDFAMTVVQKDLMADFLERNIPNMPIYSIEKFPTGDKFDWVQEGTLLKLYVKDSEPSSDQMVEIVNGKMSKLLFLDAFSKTNYLNFFDEHIVAVYSRFYAKNGSELLGRGKYVEAANYFQKALDISEDNVDAHFGLGVAFYELKKCEDSKKEFELLTVQDRNFWQAWDGLGQVYEKCFGDSEKAKEFYNRSIAIREGSYSKPIEEF